MSSSNRSAVSDDVESNYKALKALRNTEVTSFSWNSISVTVKDNETKEPKLLLDSVDGSVRPGELVALMGPSGSGKTTLLNVLARRTAAANAKVDGDVLVNGERLSLQEFRRISSYVEQDDALIGSLTVQETISFAAQLSLSRRIPKAQKNQRVADIIDSFGLRNQANTIIGTPVKKGISGGQKRRVSVASQLMSNPRVLFLDEPTSGLDSAASFEVISFLKKIARENNLLVIASIHQPSTTTFNLFDKLLLLSSGKTIYHGPVSDVNSYFSSIGHPVPGYTNPAEFIIDLVNTDFSMDGEKNERHRNSITQAWKNSMMSKTLANQLRETHTMDLGAHEDIAKPGFFSQTLTLLNRLWIKSYRDVLAYGVRIAMYMGLAIMMGTVWLRLKEQQDYIQPFINAIFFGSAFMSFMAVAYVPAFLEDFHTFTKERSNGLYGATSFLLANFLIGLPYLFLISCLFSLITYFLANFRPTATAFFFYLMWLFLDLLAAESLVVLISVLLPNFVLSLAVTAFANGLWMSVGGFLVSDKILNVFWKYVFSYIDYQSYVFKGMMYNEFSERTFQCSAAAPPCFCSYDSPLAEECKIPGTAVLTQYGFSAKDKRAQWVGILLGITLGLRLLAWVVLKTVRR